MAEDMIERAAKALQQASHWSYHENDARAALLAALDPEDEALVSELQVAIEQVTIYGARGDLPYAEARAALVALKQKAQGVSVVRSDMREKD